MFCRSALLILMLTFCIFIYSCSEAEQQAEDATLSGLSSDLYLSEMTTDQKTTFCSWYVEYFGGEGFQHSCYEQDENVTDTEQTASYITIPSVEACLKGGQFSECKLELVEKCYKATAGDACKVEQIAECTEMLRCLVENETTNPPPNNLCLLYPVKCYCSAEDDEDDWIFWSFEKSCFGLWPFGCSVHNCYRNWDKLVEGVCRSEHNLCDECPNQKCTHARWSED